MKHTDPLILLTNDDGIRSPGLMAAAQALDGLGELLVVAPREQQSSSARAFYARSQRVHKYVVRVNGTPVRALGVDASPAASVRYGVLVVAGRKPDLVVSGINYGENLGSGLTISGTVGAAIEGACFGIPALAVSLETDKAYHTSHSRRVRFDAAARFLRRLAARVLRQGLAAGVDVLNVNVPREATPETPCRVARASRQSYFASTVQGRRITGYDVAVDLKTLEPDSDIYTLLVKRSVSVTPLTFDLTARVNARRQLNQLLCPKE